MEPRFEAAAIAIFTGELDELQRVLDAEPTLITEPSSVSHRSLLQLVACEAPNITDPVGAARVLVDRGDPTWEPVVSAAGCNSLDVLAYFIDAGLPFDGEDVWTPLEEAVYWCNGDAAALLVEHGAHVRSLAAAAGLGDQAAIEGFFDDNVVRAEAGPIRSPFPDTVPAERAADPSAIVDHAFVMAVNAGQLDAAKQLLARGARVNEKPPGYHWHGTALHAAAWRGDPAIVQWLMSAGADPTIRDGLANSDAAGWATHHGHAHLVELL